MILLEVVINDLPPRRIGVKHSGVVSSVLSIVQKVNNNRIEERISFEVGGLINRPKGYKEYLRWLESSLKVGDKVIIRICNGSKSESPVHKRIESPQAKAAAKRKYLRNLAKETSRKK